MWLLDFLSSIGMDSQAIAAKNGIYDTQHYGHDTLISAQQHKGVLLDAMHAYSGTDLACIASSNTPLC